MRVNQTGEFSSPQHTAGSPIDEKVKWTNMTRQEIADKLGENGFPVSVTVVDQLLEKQGYCPRQAFKSEAGKYSRA